MDYNIFNTFGNEWGALPVAMLVLFFILALGFYVYFALAFMTIAKKLKYKYPWLAWIPIANGAMILQLGNFHWALIFLVLIPFAGWAAIWVLTIIALWRIFEKRKYPGALSLIPIAGFIPFVSWIATIAYAIAVGFAAWKDK